MAKLTRSSSKPQFETAGGSLVVNAPAKINVFLLVTPRRRDGFHGVETLMTKVSWYDQIIIEEGAGKGIGMICGGPCWAPQDETNLVYRAAKLLRDAGVLKCGVRLGLVKNIPAGTGLGSASSDCASTIMGLNRFFDLGMSDEEMMGFAGQLGSDIPFFIGPSAALCGGRGEIIEKTLELGSFETVIVVPDISVSTKRVYGNYVFDEKLYEQLKNRILPEISNKSLDLRESICVNMLQRTCFQLEPELENMKRGIEKTSRIKLMVTGSGSAMFVLPGQMECLEGVCLDSSLERYGCVGVRVDKNEW